MKPELFEELLESVRQGGAILRGEIPPSRKCIVERSGEDSQVTITEVTPTREDYLK